MPPEALDGRKISATNDKHDIWSLGVILHEIFAGSNPFQYNEFVLKNIITGNYQIDYLKIKKNSVVDQIIKGCLVYDEAKRMNIKEVLCVLNTCNQFSRNPTLFVKPNQETNINPISINGPSIEQDDLSKTEFDVISQNRHDPVKREKLIKIISHISNKSQSFKIVYNKSEYSRSGIFHFFHKNEVPSHYEGDQMSKNLREVFPFFGFFFNVVIKSFFSGSISTGIILSNLDLGESDAYLSKNLCSYLQTNSTIEILGLTDDDTLFNRENLKIGEKIAEVISKSKSIQVLDLNNNNLGSASNLKSIEMVFEAISKNKNIIRLFLTSNNLGSASNLKVIVAISEAIQKNKNIRRLDLTDNNFGNASDFKVIEVMFEAIRKNKSITALFLNKNNLGSASNHKAIEIMFESISKNQSIKWLDLNNNNLGSTSNLKNLLIMFEAIGENKNITGLHLTNNNWKKDSDQMGLLDNLMKKRKDIDYFGVDLS